MKRALSSKETGYIDIAPATYACDTTGSVTLLNAVPTGTTVTTRIGKKIQMKSLQCRGNLVAKTTTTLADTAHLIIYDKRPTGALPSITDILVSISTASMNNDNNSGRFQILKRDDTLLIGNITTPTTGREGEDRDWFLDLHSKEVVYKALGTGAIADIEQGALYLVTLGGVAAGTAAAEFVAGFRLRFFDV